MIKFFRKIRQNLLAEGKTTKYFKYAFGEIILVVIGILIALQLNNWNQNRIDDIESKNFSLRLYNEVKSNLIIVEEEINKEKRQLECSKMLLKIFSRTHKSINI
ncbi:MAG: hypothetical protein HC798_00145 [Polaribacter sp.]|nr:hypothetical protein [Polaribacter sp.]